VLGDTAMMRSAGNSRSSKSHNAGRRCGSSKAISRKSGFVSATSEGTSCSLSVSPTTLIPACSESVDSTSSRRSRGRLATRTRMLVSMCSFAEEEESNGKKKKGTEWERYGAGVLEKRSIVPSVRGLAKYVLGTGLGSRGRRDKRFTRSARTPQQFGLFVWRGGY